MNTQFHAKTFAEALSVSKQRVSSLLKLGTLKGIKMGRDMIIDVRDPVNFHWLKTRESLSAELARMVAYVEQDALPDSLNEQDDDEEPVYARSVVEQCIKEAWEKCLAYASILTLPVSLEQLARAVLKAGTIKKAATVVRKSIKTDLADIEGYVDHAIALIIDGEEAAERWNDEHYDEDGNPRASTTT